MGPSAGGAHMWDRSGGSMLTCNATWMCERAHWLGPTRGTMRWWGHMWSGTMSWWGHLMLGPLWDQILLSFFQVVL
jgi:hypothetical protein